MTTNRHQITLDFKKYVILPEDATQEDITEAWDTFIDECVGDDISKSQAGAFKRFGPKQQTN